VIDAADIQRLHLGHYTMPPPEPEETEADPKRGVLFAHD
jgi:hypothetical protein